MISLRPILLGHMCAIAVIVGACGTNTSTPPSTVTVTKPAFSFPSTTANVPTTSAYALPTTAAAASITIPDLTGQNAKIAQHKLSDLGLTDVTLASANPKYKMVILPENWTVVSIEPAPGTSVSADDPVVVNVTKP